MPKFLKHARQTGEKASGRALLFHAQSRTCALALQVETRHESNLATVLALHLVSALGDVKAMCEAPSHLQTLRSNVLETSCVKNAWMKVLRLPKACVYDIGTGQGQEFHRIWSHVGSD